MNFKAAAMRYVKFSKSSDTIFIFNYFGFLFNRDSAEVIIRDNIPIYFHFKALENYTAYMQGSLTAVKEVED